MNFVKTIHCSLIFCFSNFFSFSLEVENNKIDDNNGKNIKNVISNSQQMYDYVKNELLTNGATSVNYLKYRELTEEIEEYSKSKKGKKKKKKSKKKEELTGEEKIIEEKKLQLKEIKKNIKLNDNLRILFSMFEDSSLFNKIIESNPSWGKEELIQLETLGNNSKSRSLVETINLYYTMIGHLSSSLALIHEDDSKITSSLEAFSDVDINDLTESFRFLSTIESSFVNFYSNKSAKKRYKIGDNDFNAIVDFRGNLVKKTNHLNLKFLFLFLNPYSIFTLIINIFPCFFKGTCKSLGKLYGNLCMSDTYNPLKIENIGITIMNYFLIFMIIRKIYKYISPDLFMNVLSKRFYVIKSYLGGIRKVYDVFQSSGPLFSVFGDRLTNCRNLFYDNEDFTKEQKEMLRLLSIIPLKWSPWRLTKGNLFDLCNFFYLFDKHKKLFINAIFEIADLERYVRIYKLLNDDNYKNLICVPKFVNTSTPLVELKEAYNPFIDVNKAVKNDIVLGKDNTLGVIYGMNAAGKSTILRTVALNYILGKSLGICFAKEAELSNFKRVYLAMNITDDINNRLSKFMSEIISVDKLIDIILTSKDNEFVLFLSDEAFSGTNSETGDSFNGNILRFLLNNTNNITLYSTHSINSAVIANSSKKAAIYIMDTEISGSDVKYKYKIRRYTGKVEPIEKRADNRELLNVSKNVAVALVNKLYYDGLIKHPKVILGDV